VASVLSVWAEALVSASGSASVTGGMRTFLRGCDAW
jgi:hypothetical protein